MIAQSCAKVKIVAEMAAHQKREWWRRLTMRSEPMPDARRPVKEERERMETWKSWEWAMSALGVEGEEWV